MMKTLLKVAYLTTTLVAVAAPPVHAEFFNDVKRTFQTDVPHFFQDDIPCAFGGQPTSHTRTSCKSNGQAAAGQPGDPARMPLRGESPANLNPPPAPVPIAPASITPKPFQY